MSPEGGRSGRSVDFFRETAAPDTVRDPRDTVLVRAVLCLCVATGVTAVCLSGFMSGAAVSLCPMCAVSFRDTEGARSLRLARSLRFCLSPSLRGVVPAHSPRTLAAVTHWSSRERVPSRCSHRLVASCSLECADPQNGDVAGSTSGARHSGRLDPDGSPLLVLGGKLVSSLTNVV